MMNDYKVIARQLQRDYLLQTASKGEILGLIAADYYQAIARLFKSAGKRFTEMKHPSSAILPTVILPQRWL
jgi:hypothetical protein